MKRFGTFIAAGILMTATAIPAQAEIKVSYLYNLSDFTGSIPYTSPRLHVDDRYQETYVMAGNTVKVFNDSCMEVYRFDLDWKYGYILDLTTDERGQILLLTLLNGTTNIRVCDYRGELQGEIKVTGLPEDFQSFTPNRIVRRDNELLLASYTAKKVAIIDESGKFVRGMDLTANLKDDDEQSDKKSDDGEIGAMAFAANGDILVSMPIMGRVFRVSADGKTQMFGKRGSAPGRFGIPSGVAVDQQENIYISDRLRCVVLVFDKNLKFVREFGSRGFGPGNLIVPNEVAMDRSNRIYVTQQRNRGVSVYQTTTE